MRSAPCHLGKKLLANIGVNPGAAAARMGVGIARAHAFAEIVHELSARINENSARSASGEGKLDRRTAGGLKPWPATWCPTSSWWSGRSLRVRFRGRRELSQIFASAEFDRLFDELIADKLAIGRIMVLRPAQARGDRRNRRHPGYEPV